jgi:hypothetical protein
MHQGIDQRKSAAHTAVYEHFEEVDNAAIER